MTFLPPPPQSSLSSSSSSSIVSSGVILRNVIDHFDHKMSVEKRCDIYCHLFFADDIALVAIATN